MPIEVNVEERLRRIAEATFVVASTQGVHAVSYRSVAKRLGGSTAIVTNYLPTRSALLQNALRHVLLSWHDEMAAAAEDAAPGDQLRTLAQWSCTTQPEDLVLRHILIHALAEEVAAPAEMLDAFQADAAAHRTALAEAATADGYRDPEALVDAIYLLCRGFYLSTVEDVSSWDHERAWAAIDAVLTGWPREQPAAIEDTSRSSA